jgi:adenosylmethionine-8-amino-7-oxononanoate aminotransferase
MGHATACAAALAVQRVIQQDQLLDNVLARGEQLRAELRSAFDDHPHVGDIRGRGLFTGVEFVQDKATKATLDPSLKTAARLKKQAMQNGLLIYPMAGTVDGAHGDHVLLAPPFICSADHISEIVNRLVKTVSDVVADVATA